MEDLIAALAAAERQNQHSRPCQACETLIDLKGTTYFEPVQRALGGTIGAVKLAKILTANGLTVGRRAIDRHRTEGHTV